VNARSADGGSAIAWASANDCVEMVRLLVRNGANPKLAFWRPHSAVDEAQVTVSGAIQTCLTSNVRLLAAARGGDLCALKEALVCGAFVDTREPSTRFAAMTWAVMNNCHEAVVALHSARADLESRDALGWTAVHCAVINGNATALSALHFVKANLATRTWDGVKASHLAARSGDWHLLQMLHVAKMDFEAKNSEGHTCLQVAVIAGHPLAISTLLAFNLDTTVKDHYKRSVFHLAVVHGNLRAAQVLVRPVEPPKFEPGVKPAGKQAKKGKIKKGQDATSKKGQKDAPGKKTPHAKSSGKRGGNGKKQGHDPEGNASSPKNTTGRKKTMGKEDAPHAADNVEPHAANNHSGPVFALVKDAKSLRDSLPAHSPAVISTKGALSEQDASSRTALTLAIRYQRAEVVPFLIESSADVDHVDKQGATPLMLAAAWGEMFVIDAILNEKAKMDTVDKHGRDAIMYATNAKVRSMLQSRSDKAEVLLHLKNIASAPPVKVRVSKSQSTPVLPPVRKSREANVVHRQKETDKGPFYRVRVENLPVRIPLDCLEDQIRSLLGKHGPEFVPVRVVVPVDPIMERPLGHAYLDFKHEAQANLLENWGGDSLFGGDGGWNRCGMVKVVREPMVSAATDDSTATDLN